MISKLLQNAAVLFSLMVAASPAHSNPTHSGDIEHRTVEKVIHAYGGKEFRELKSLTLKSDLRYGGLGQGYTPDYVDLDPMLKVHEFDLVNGFGSEEAWGQQGGYAERIFTNSGGQFTVDFNNKTYALDSEADLYAHFGGEIRTSDTLLAYDLMKHRDSAKHKGQKYFRGVAHDLLEFDMPGTSIDPELWIDSKTGLISKMRRVIPGYNTVSYVFNDFKRAGRISYAEVFELFVGSTLVEYAKSRKLVPNQVKKSVFVLDDGINPQPAAPDVGEMSVDLVGGSLHRVGQGYAFSAFFDTGDYVISVGGSAGFGDRFKAYQDALGHRKPLKYLILTHHHRGHLDGAGEALELGAQLVAPETVGQNLTDVVELNLSDTQLMTLSSAKTSLGSVDIHLVSTGLVGDFALTYFSEPKAAFDAGHYNAKFKDRASYVSPFAMSFKSEINRLGLDVDYLITAHSRKTEKWSDFLDMANLYSPGKCQTGREICAHLR